MRKLLGLLLLICSIPAFAQKNQATLLSEIDSNIRLVSSDKTKLSAVLDDMVKNSLLRIEAITLSGTDAYTSTPTGIELTSYVSNTSYKVKIPNTNTGASSVNFSSLGAKAIKKRGISGLIDVDAGDLHAGYVYDLVYDGTYMQVTDIPLVTLNPGSGINISGMTINAGGELTGDLIFDGVDYTSHAVLFTGLAGFSVSTGGGVDINIETDANVNFSSTGYLFHTGTGNMLTIDGAGTFVDITGGGTADFQVNAHYITFTPGTSGGGTRATGDIWYNDASNHIHRLGIGSTNQVLTVTSGLPAWATSAAGFSNPMTTIGDLIQGSTAGAAVRVAAVATGNALISGGVGTLSTWGKIGLATHVSGNLPVTNLNSGTSASSSTYWRGDGTWGTPAGSGTVTSVAASVPSFLSLSGSPITSTGTLAISYSGTALPVANGGTGLTTYAIGDIPYASGTGTLGTITAITGGSVLGSNGVGAAPLYLTVNNGLTITSGTFQLGGPLIANTSITGNFLLQIGTSGSPLSQYVLRTGTNQYITQSSSGTLISNAANQTIDLQAGASSFNFDATHGLSINSSGILFNTGGVDATGDIWYRNSGGRFTRLGIGSTGDVLKVASGLPSWGSVAGSGTVTSVAMTVPSFLSLSGSPITSSGTLAVTLSGTALPILNGGTGQTTANAALNAFLPTQTSNSGKFLTTDGTNTSWATVGGGGTVTIVTSADGNATVATTTTTPVITIVSAPKWATARNLAGNSVDGSANVAFTNKFIVQGTTDAGLSGAQFLGSLSTGIVKNTTTTGILSIATNADLPAMSATVGGAVPTPPNNTTTFLRGDGTFNTPPGGSGTPAYIDEVSTTTTGSTITLDMNSQIQRLHIGSATFATAKTIAISNATNALVFDWMFEITNVAATLTLPTVWLMQDTRFASHVFTATATGKYEMSGTYDGTNWRIKIAGPFL